MLNLLLSSLLSFWIATIAILSVQNATPVTLRFFSLQSVQLPAGLVLAFSTGIGAISMAALQVIWEVTQSSPDELLDDEDLGNDEEKDSAEDW
ncbi:hypothetical protein BST81_00925 [Leptolyngbya sp. 'hensonii']|uniref:lipopolysaccharide assembly protein LapA domain-containing protein n=1 Tax=Leptolyngbya sp. 'hensonii' TaxID=1922337 RepID=UPI00094F6482|nr:LapA family protein [Leptolyngbya sp. 'hensonii']OLP20331.1 hypothetical protein BST81_00925 [Leptolyngbya sp. 'hensonii']